MIIFLKYSSKFTISICWYIFTGEVLAGNKMDSSNLATLFAPNILRPNKPGADPISSAEMAVHADERIDVINVIRSMIDHNKELFEVFSFMVYLVFFKMFDWIYKCSFSRTFMFSVRNYILFFNYVLYYKFFNLI